MIGRRIQGLSTGSAVLSSSFREPPKQRHSRRRRTFIAFLTGVSLLVVGGGCLRTGLAAGLVNGLNSPIGFILHQAGYNSPERSRDPVVAPQLVQISSDRPRAHKHGQQPVKMTARAT